MSVTILDLGLPYFCGNTQVNPDKDRSLISLWRTQSVYFKVSTGAPFLLMISEKSSQSHSIRGYSFLHHNDNVDNVNNQNYRFTMWLIRRCLVLESNSTFSLMSICAVIVDVVYLFIYFNGVAAVLCLGLFLSRFIYVVIYFVFVVICMYVCM